MSFPALRTVAEDTNAPAALPDETELQFAGAEEVMTLVACGATYLRLTTLPVIPAGKLQPAKL